VQLGARPIEGAEAAEGERLRQTQILMFNSGGTGARPNLDGLSATAFPSGVHTMSSEVIEHVGPITVWRKELREGSGGAGRQRGGLGQIIEISANPGHSIYINAMFDRCDNPASGREGGQHGAPGNVSLNDGSPMQSKGKQWIPDGKHLLLSLPGGGGYGEPKRRDRALVQQDILRGYISEDEASRLYEYLPD
jgi:N-methylhydantoinase B